jgi:hypothetical protein
MGLADEREAGLARLDWRFKQQQRNFIRRRCVRSRRLHLPVQPVRTGSGQTHVTLVYF